MLNCTFAERPGPCSPAATGITVARPGHDCDCAQAPVWLAACRAAGVVTRSRLVVHKTWIRPWARGPVTVPVRLLATRAYPTNDGWHASAQFKFSWLRMEGGDKSRGEADHDYDTGIPSHPMLNGPPDSDKTRNSPNLEHNCPIERRDAACTLLTYKLLSGSCTMLYNCF